MRKQTFTPSSGRLLRLLLFLFLSVSVTFWGCDKAEETAVPGATATLSATQTQAAKADSDKDDKYKTDKTGQYVSKDVQVTGYEDGRERPTRPKYDAADGSIGTYSEPPCTDCGTGGGGTVTPPPAPTSTFVSSVGIGHTTTSKGTIYDLKVIKGSSSSIGTSDLPGYYKINADLNTGAGGKYIYLCFTRDPSKVQGSDEGPSAWVNSPAAGKYVPVIDIKVESETVGNPFRAWPYLDCSPPIELKDPIDLGFHVPDLNDGAGGKYIYAYQVKCAVNKQVIQEVGVIYGNSSSIQPPTGWVKIPGDLNEGAGGSYIYFCVKR